MSDLRNRAKPATFPFVPWSKEREMVDSWRQAEQLSAARPEVVPPLGQSPYLRERYEALQCALTQPCVVMRETNAHLVNSGNGRQGTTVAGMHARNVSRKSHRAMGLGFARELFAVVGPGNGFHVVVLTRIAPRTLDGLNLDYTFKSVIDGIAEGLGVDDRSPLVRYVTNQEQGGVRVHRVRCELFIQPRGALTRNEVSEEAT